MADETPDPWKDADRNPAGLMDRTAPLPEGIRWLADEPILLAGEAPRWWDVRATAGELGIPSLVGMADTQANAERILDVLAAAGVAYSGHIERQYPPRSLRPA